MPEPKTLSLLRASRWSDVPSAPGVYWWYFPETALDDLGLLELCDPDQLRLRRAPDGKVCLYHGMANDLAGRIRWHGAQKLTRSALESGFLSTFRFTLLALNGFDYARGAELIDRFFDTLSVSWQLAESRAQAQALEHAELQGPYHYPLNISGNQRSELKPYLRHLKSVRRDYKQRHLGAAAPADPPSDATVYLVSCVSQKGEMPCSARDLYTSAWFLKARRYAEVSGRPWFILSAEYGLLPPDRVVAPYERTLNTMPVAERRAWADRITRQLAEAVPELCRAVFLAGQRYREFLIGSLAERGVSVSVPMEGLRIGEQLRWLGRHSPPPG